MGKKIGIMGGTFNPIHNGHLLLAETAREILGLDKVIFMPSGNSYMKNASSILKGEERAYMVELAIEGNPYFCLSLMELKRQGPTYTCDTLAELKSQYPEDEFYFIAGADTLLTLESWKEPALVLKNCVMVVAVRGTGVEKQLMEKVKRIVFQYHADIRMLPTRYVDISSSEIRQKRKEGHSIRYMVPENVFAYIEQNNLFCNKRV
ncbi:nicotinate-nucleotide adenylyltransferase [Parablautia muri]|uniref:Probable nicotinate-nucleotide adenylyltransferase n=1 Tax=Parablautia muri TaxID=2320879 RepID=A0A9X5BCS4_9FIRM|nr:nicotinate-nucleotide adenylyltransferase [Parablautia muri]NBJ91455.1 nicotinate-nucleotide adenylyltransferase [Parablautia muri]